MCSSDLQKIPLPRRANQWPLFARLAPTRGALRDRHECWARDAMGVLMSPDERRRCDRRNRVVLVPRRWDQVSQDDDVGPLGATRRDLRNDGGNKARSPGRARISRKTIARGMPNCFGEPAVTNACAYYQCTRGCGCAVHPAFPAPSLLEEGQQRCKARANSRRGNAQPCFSFVIASEAKQSMAQQAEIWIASSLRSSQ